MSSLREKICIEDGCGRPVKARRRCGIHYRITLALSAPPCQILGCTAPAYCKELCQKHYARVKKHGDPHFIGKQWKLSPEDRFMSYVTKTEECWLWQGTRFRLGYGSFSVNGSPVSAHRFAYEMFVGAIPVGLELDHLCRVRHCVNPSHLEPVTHQENMRRARRPVCPRGHEYDGTASNGDGTFKRVCNTCRRLRAANKLTGDGNVTV